VPIKLVSPRQFLLKCLHQAKKVDGLVFVCYVMYLCVIGIDFASFYDFDI